ncbi:MAG: 50S ribosomal protein L35 [Acidobacteriia bacterium]|nr:50S ribosomal protein L35 [Terriglobia bacterium]
MAKFKQKSHRGAAKRFKLTAHGHVKRGHAYARHLLSSKTTKVKRKLDKDGLVSKADERNVKRLLMYS